MKKTIIGSEAGKADAVDAWLDLETLAAVEVTSEAAGHPIESALFDDKAGGWRAGTAGEQTVRLRFEVPQRVRRIVVEIDDAEAERTQELHVTWEDTAGQVREVVRQRWNFSPQGSTREAEDYRVSLDDVRVLELCLQPDVASAKAFACLSKLRLG